jgi:uncharacterized RDD family membrane protein YckC
MNDPLAQNENNETKTGVYYRDADYAGFFRRIVIAMIDLFVIYLGMVILNICWSVFVPSSSLPSSSLLTWLVVAYLYLAILKRTSVRTLGYILTGVEIVNLKGERPSWATMSFRFIILALVPLHLIVDILWLTREQEKQTLRDKIAGTYVIRKNAQPVGEGVQIVVIYHLLGFALSLRELKRDV